MSTKLLTALLCAAVATFLTNTALGESGQKPTVTALEAVGGTFRATLSDGSTRQGAELTGMILTYSDGDHAIQIKLNGVRADPKDQTGKLLLHDLRFADTGNPYCLPSADGLREGYAIPGRADADGTIHPTETGAFEIACTSGAQGKCLRFGYRPWDIGPDGRSLQERYNACIHMVRADYCGDGTPTTIDGTVIDIFDDAGIQKPDRAPGFTFEAAWSPAGAVCVAHVRIVENISLQRLAETCPRLVGKLGSEVCREGMVSGEVYNLSK